MWAIGSLFAVEENRHAASVADFSVDYFVTIHNETLASRFDEVCGLTMLQLQPKLPQSKQYDVAPVASASLSSLSWTLTTAETAVMYYLKTESSGNQKVKS